MCETPLGRARTSSRSGETAQLIIVAWSVPNFRQEIRQAYYRNDPVKYDLVLFEFTRS